MTLDDLNARAVEPADEMMVWIDYTNHRGERRWRKITPMGMGFRKTEWHPERQWLMTAFDWDKGATRDFAKASIHGWRTTPPPP